LTRPTPDDEEIIYASAPRLAAIATDSLYAEKPQLETLGEKGRSHTTEDFGHHLRALSSLDSERFADYVRYCIGLFDARGFPQEWLTDAWRHIEIVVRQELPASVSKRAIDVLHAAVDDTPGGPADVSG
jgi:hypothetical protein